jgi:small subunit ribosomal protein S2
MGVDTGAAAEPIAEDLPAAPAEPAYEVLSGPRGVADDLKKLGHVSPTIEKKLNDLGIFHYRQIAGLSPDAAHQIGEEVGLPGRMEGWIAQSKELSAE